MKVKLDTLDDFLYFGLILSILVRWCTSLFQYSGMNTPPMYGDFEAQRHWMEITINLPISEWYRNSSNNDLLYWGLDYPPLTAYHSYLCGLISHHINPSWVALNKSRGLTDQNHKLFMRNTVLAADLFIYIPAVIFFWHSSLRPTSPRDKAVATIIMLLYPGLILIDHGHFQYNCISLGLCLWAVSLLGLKNPLLASLLFTLSLNYKQMELYHAMPFFCYLLGSVLQQHHTLSSRAKAVAQLGGVVLGTTTLCWLPFLIPPASPYDVLIRLFPFDRGLYEDKVANVWCVLSVIVKLKSLLSISALAILSGLTTLLALIPSSFHLLQNPSFQNFKFALVNSSLVFFLLSYQVHEKSILLAALPALLLIDDHPVIVTWFLSISTVSLFPLLHKDHLVIPFYSLMVLFLMSCVQGYTSPSMSWFRRNRLNLLFWGSHIISLILTVAKLKVPAPAKYPDLHLLINCGWCCLHFVGFALYFHRLQLYSLDTTKLKKR